jgi:hypothetical protein
MKLKTNGRDIWYEGTPLSTFMREYFPYDSVTGQGDGNQAHQLVDAYNATYGEGIKPEAVPEMVKALEVFRDGIAELNTIHFDSAHKLGQFFQKVRPLVESALNNLKTTQP